MRKIEDQNYLLMICIESPGGLMGAPTGGSGAPRAMFRYRGCTATI